MGKKVVIIIPARYDSTRLPGKILKTAGNLPVLYYVLRNGLQSKLAEDVYIATDSEKVKGEMLKYTKNIIMTSSAHKSGTDRINEAVQNIDCDIIVNLQGDEPLLTAEYIDKAVEPVLNGECEVSTLKTPCTDGECADPNVVKVVTDKNDFALYFSRSPVPYERHTGHIIVFKHIGIYVYTKRVLNIFSNLPSSKLEKAESLEQLRLLENGYKIKVVPVDYAGNGIDTAADLENFRNMIADRGVK